MLPNLVALSFITLPVASLTLTTVTYNMLSTSLSSPSIPWLLKLPKTIDPTGAVLEQGETRERRNGAIEAVGAMRLLRLLRLWGVRRLEATV